MAYGLTNSASFVTASVNSFSRADTASLSITGACTVEFWINPQANGDYNVISKTTGTNNRSYRLAYVNSSTQLIFSVSGDGSTLTSATITQTLTVGTWYHVAGVYTPSTSLEIFVNGTSIGSNVTSIPASMFDGNTATYIAGQSDGPGGMTAYVSLVRVWSVARTGAQLTTSMCQVLGSTSNLAAEWTLDNTVNDNSGNANTLTNNNSTAFTANLPSTCTAPSTTLPYRSLMGVGI